MPQLISSKMARLKWGETQKEGTFQKELILVMTQQRQGRKLNFSPNISPNYVT
jgi:hypothetical protein